MSYLINDSFNNGTGLTSLYFLGNSLSNLETKTEHDTDIANINNSLSNINNSLSNLETKTGHDADISSINNSLSNLETKTEHDADIASINNSLSNLSTFQSDVGSFTRSTLSSTETVYYNHSLGHSPKNILFYGPSRFWNSSVTSFGAYANNKNYCYGGGLGISSSYIYTYQDAEGDTINAIVSSVSSSNFGIYWTISGSISGANLNFMFVASG